MTINDVKERLDEIRITATVEKDEEKAHIEEKKLWEDVLASIAKGFCNAPEGVAREALKSKRIEFARWFA